VQDALHFWYMNPTVKRYLISSATTFISTFLIVGGVAIQNGAADTFTPSAIIAVAMTAFRAAVKAVVEAYAGQADPTANL
jgi:hypothetical protein